MSQYPVIGPFSETDLCNEFRSYPAQLRHVFLGYSFAEVTRLADRQVDKRATLRGQGLEKLEQRRPQSWIESLAHFAGEHEIATRVVTN